MPGPHIKGKFHAANIQHTVLLIFVQLLPIIKSWQVVGIQPAHLIQLLAQSSVSSSLIFDISTLQSFSLIDPKKQHLGFSICQHYSYIWRKTPAFESTSCLSWFYGFYSLLKCLLFFNAPDLATTSAWFWYLRVAMALSTFKSVQKSMNKISTFFLPCKLDTEEVLLSRTLLAFPSSSVCWKGWRCCLLSKSDTAHSCSGCLHCPHVQDCWSAEIALPTDNSCSHHWSWVRKLMC